MRPLGAVLLAPNDEGAPGGFVPQYPLSDRGRFRGRRVCSTRGCLGAGLIRGTIRRPLSMFSARSDRFVERGAPGLSLHQFNRG
jgi:hypothetical protein